MTETTDLELLELAAKAAGIEHEGEASPWLAGRGKVALILRCSDTIWRPLTDDGDALRLAVKLNLWEAIRTAHRLLGAPGAEDMYAATRRAIVRAAAELGRSMP